MGGVKAVGDTRPLPAAVARAARLSGGPFCAEAHGAGPSSAALRRRVLGPHPPACTVRTVPVFPSAIREGRTTPIALLAGGPG